ncbi:ribonucleoside triphosphate reductase [candidate division FCPU426 bacterium]|nr:ribonucleoside triphosphate reductase [candidate division FCPU426 bacterium]
MEIQGIGQIRKRDGRLVPFDEQKIINAIYRAMSAAGQHDLGQAQNVARRVHNVLKAIYKGDKIPTVENVQDVVETTLMDEGFKEVSKQYILYRAQHTKLRQTQELFSSAHEIIDNYLGKNDWRIKENSNMSYSLQGMNNHITAILVSQYWLEELHSERVRNAHLSGDFHIHDLGSLSVYCCGWDLRDLLLKGLQGAYGKTESGPPKHFRTALGQVCNFFFTLQGEAAGAQAFSNFDTYLAPFIAYDRLNYPEVVQCMQEFIFNVNVPTRVGFQTPFTNITLDLQVPERMKNEPVVIGGDLQERTYGEFQAEMDMLNRAFCQVMMCGDARGRIFTFPIPTYNLSKDFNWEGPIVSDIFAMTAKYGIPYFANFINSDMDPEDARSMCCRLRLDNRELRKRGGGLFGSNPLTGSLGVVTLNLPRAAYLSTSEEEFHSRILNLMDISRESLQTKRKIVERYTDKNLYPYSKFYLSGVKQRTGQYWANHFSTIGLSGMHEAVLNLTGQGIETPAGRALALRTLQVMRQRLREYQEEDGELYNLEATPAEGTSYRFARMDRREFPDIITSGTEEPYYTNSTQYPVNASTDIFEVLEHQDELQCSYTGGTVLHLFLGESISDANACKKLVRRIAENYHLPYFTISPTFSICPVHGFIRGEHHVCPYEKEEANLEQQEIKAAPAAEMLSVKAKTPDHTPVML